MYFRGSNPLNVDWTLKVLRLVFPDIRVVVLDCVTGVVMGFQDGAALW